jgi:hypothetical protein
VLVVHVAWWVGLWEDVLVCGCVECEATVCGVVWQRGSRGVEGGKGEVGIKGFIGL